MGSRRTAAAALGLSLAAHALLALWIWRTPAAPVRTSEPEPLTFEIVAPRARPAPPPIAPEPQPAPTPKPQAHAHPGAPRAKVLPGAVLPPWVAPPPPSSVAAPPPSDVPMAPDVPRAPDLAGAAMAVGKRAELPAAEPPRGVVAPEVIADPNARTAALISGGMGKARVQRGLVDPYFTQVGHALAKGWNTHSKLLDANLESFGAQLGKNTKLAARVYQKFAQRYGESGTPLDVPTDAPRDAALTDFQAMNDYRQRVREAWRESKKVLVRLTQGAGGVVQAVELVQASDDPDLDAEVLGELRAGTITLPIPPSSGLGIHTPIRSVWAFRLVISISPPVPTITGAFDEVTRTFDVRRPLDRRVYKYVELVSVD